MISMPVIGRVEKSTNPSGDLPDEVVESYNKVVENVSLVDIRLTRTSAESHPERLREGDDSVQIEIGTPQYRVTITSTSIHAGARFRVDVISRVERDAGAIVSIEADYLVTYALDHAGDYIEQAVRLFAEKNGVFNSWPFFRDLAHSLATKMGMPPIVVPLLKLPPSSPHIRPDFR